MGAKYFGAAVKRREDPRFLRGEGRFHRRRGAAGHAARAFVRSPHAHAVVRKIHTDAAAAAPGVTRVFTFADLERWMKPLPLFRRRAGRARRGGQVRPPAGASVGALP